MDTWTAEQVDVSTIRHPAIATLERSRADKVDFTRT